MGPRPSLAWLVCFVALRSSALSPATPAATAIPRGGVFELAVQVPHEGLDADDVRLRGRFSLPSGGEQVVAGFAHRGAFAVRYAPSEVGRYRYVVEADRGGGYVTVAEGRFVAVEGVRAGPVRRDPMHPWGLVRGDGRPFVILGENRINVYDPTWNAGGRDIEAYLAFMAENGMNTIRVFVFGDCVNEASPDRYQPGCLEPRAGRFDDLAGNRFDRLFEAAGRHGLQVILVAFAVGFTPGEETWKAWQQGPYAAENGGPVRTPQELFETQAGLAATTRRLEYLLARYGAYENLLAIDLLNEPETDGPIPESSWIPWARTMASWWREGDLRGHLITAGPVGFAWNIGESNEGPWYEVPENDLVQWHLYGADFDEPHALAREMRRRIEETWRYRKPVFCGEFAYGGEPKPAYEHTHAGIWSAVFSGAGVLAHTAPPFEIDTDELMTPERGRHFRTLSRFLDRLHRIGRFTPREDVEAIGAEPFALGREDTRAVWLLAPRNGFEERRRVTVTLARMPAGRYRAQWFDDVTGDRIERKEAVSDGTLRIESPAFRRHVALIVEPLR